MAYTKYSLTPANNNAAPPDGAPEGMLPSSVNDTMRDMMAQIRDCGDGIRGGTYTMTAPVITGGSVSGITDLAIADGGTGASTASAARTNLGVEIGTNVQAWDADLDTWATKTAPTGTVVGTSDTQTLTNKTLTTPTIDKINTSVANTSLGAGNASIMKNRIINGAMLVNQRGGTVTGNDNAYSLDRWKASCVPDGKFTMQQSSTAPVGFINSLLVTSTSAYSVASTDFIGIRQDIEGLNCTDLAWGTANAKTVTLSFQVYSSLTGTFGGSLFNNAGNRSYPFSYTISSANTWTTISVTIAGDTTGTWLTTNGRGICVFFNLGSGSSNSGTANAWANTFYAAPTGATSVVGTNGATFYITGVQLEVGSSATGFEYVNYQTSLANCQRYFQSYGGVSANDMVCMGLTSSTSLSVAILQLPVTMRTSPSVGYSSTSALIVDDNGAAGTSSAISTSSLGLTSIYFTVTTGATLVANRPARIYTNGSGARLTWSAEL